MKKSLSLFVASSMVVSMFAGAAYAAEEKDPGEYLNELGVIQGDQNGDLMEDASWSRKNVTVLMSRLLGEEEEAAETEKGHEFTDVTDAYYDGFITWAVEEGLFEGNGDGTFGYGDDMTNQQFYAVILRALGYDTKGPEAYATVPDLAVEVGLTTEDTDFDAVPTRGTTYATIVTALNTNVKGTSETLGVKLGLIEVTELALGTVAQTGKGEITVNFNKAVTDAEKKDLTFTVENGLVKYPVTAKYADDNKSVVLSSTYLPAGSYTVTVGEFEAKTVTVVDEVATKIEIGATTLQKAAGQSLNVKLYNQFGKEIESPVLNVSVYNATYGKNITPDGDLKVDLSSDTVARVKDNVVVTASHVASGLSTTKSFEVVAGSSATAIQLAAPSPLKDEARITVGKDGYVLPYTFTDQYGGKVTLPEHSTEAIGSDKQVTIGGITFLVSDNTIIDEVAVDEDGVLTFNTGTQSGNVVVTALNPTTGANASITFKVEPVATVKTLQMGNPGVIVAADEDVKIPYTAADSFGAQIAAKDVSLSNIRFESSVDFTLGKEPRLNAKGELIFNFDDAAVTTDRTAYIYAYNTIDGTLAGQLQLQVRVKAEPKKVTGMTVAKYFANGADAEFKPESITYIDTYNRTQKVADFADVTITGLGTGSKLELDAVGETLTATAVGKVEVAIDLVSVTDDAAYKTTIEVVNPSDVKSYTLKSVANLYATDEVAYQKGIELVGKLSSGAEVVIDQASSYDLVTTSNAAIVDVVAGNQLQGVDAGTATIAAYKGATKLAETEVTVSKAKPVATTVEFASDEISLTSTAINPLTITVKDQYGVVVGTPIGVLSSNDTDVVEVVSGTTIRAVADGTATLTYLTSTGVTATAVVLVELP